MKPKTLIVCQITQNCLKTLKCIFSKKNEIKSVQPGCAPLPEEYDDKIILELLAPVINKREHLPCKVIACLPRSQATIRYLKIPSQSTEETEKIVSLQAVRILPYPPEELVVGYEIISKDNQGFSDINISVAHTSVIQKYTNIFCQLAITDYEIYTSSYGLTGLRNIKEGKEQNTVVMLDLDKGQGELAIINNDKLVFSRSFKIFAKEADSEARIAEEFTKTNSAYLKEFQGDQPREIILLGSGKLLQGSYPVLEKQTGIPVIKIEYWKTLNASAETEEFFTKSEYSFAALAGLLIKKPAATLNLVPPEEKIKKYNSALIKEVCKIGMLFLLALLLSGLTISMNAQKKKSLLNRFNAELAKVEKEAKPLEEITKRIVFLQQQRSNKPEIMDLISGLYSVIPENIKLASLTYDENWQLIIHGETEDVRSIFQLMKKLSDLPEFKPFSQKVSYGTKRKLRADEVIDFELVFEKK